MRRTLSTSYEVKVCGPFPISFDFQDRNPQGG
jgi:hypothetical protein